MRIARLTIENFRGIKSGEIFFQTNTVLVGDNNSGKSTILEAIDLVLGPDRMNRRPVVDEHDFFAGNYLGDEGSTGTIKVEAVVVDLSPEQTRHFHNHLECWNTETNSLVVGPPISITNSPPVVWALRVSFTGSYDVEEDDFTGETHFASPVTESGRQSVFKSSDKRQCGFLYLRTLRTGSRALSLERGSLLDIILKLKDVRLQMWEDVLSQLRKLDVASKPELGIAPILSQIQDAIRKFVPSDSAANPHLRVSDLTREHLRKTLTVFMGTGSCVGDTTYSAPFQHQGTGTINTLVFAMLSVIAELKQNVIFAMEEPEIAIPPHTQKRIIDHVRRTSAQAIFTSHSPYVLEEFPPEGILLVKRDCGIVFTMPATFPSSIKPKQYRTELRTRFAEALLAKRVLLVEGRTEYDAIPVAARRLQELAPQTYSSLEAMGFAILDAGSDSQIGPLGAHFTKLGKEVHAIFDKQTAESLDQIKAVIVNCYEQPEKGFENLLLNQTGESRLRLFAETLVNEGDWPTHLSKQKPTSDMSISNLRDALRDYLKWSKGAATSADLLERCSESEMPQFIRGVLGNMKVLVGALDDPNPGVTHGAQSEQNDGTVPDAE